MVPFMAAQCIIIFLFLLQLAHQQLDLERAALLTFKRSLTQREALANWNNRTNVCDFFGVQCDGRHVTRVSLNRSQIAGPLSPAIANLTELRDLILRENYITGSIPHELSGLRHLEFLDLSSNLLSGMILPSLGFMAHLYFLNLAGNELRGPIPETLFHNYSGIAFIDLSANALTGQIPSWTGIALPRLNTFYLYSNRLTGALPKWLSNSSELSNLDVGSNHLSGELPTEMIQQWSYLTILHLSHTNLTSHDSNTNLEPFFLALFNSSELVELEMAGLEAGGSLPTTGSWRARDLLIFNLEDNAISGEIPSSVSNFSALTLLNLSGNLLKGAIPKELFGLSRLERLWISGNALSGSIPMEIGNATNLGLLDLSRNNLVGEIPASIGIGNHTGLRDLYLHRNQLAGPIPSSLGNCVNLERLDLSYNRLSGGIPPELSGILKIFLNLSNNLLQGSLPPELSKMAFVLEIDLSVNNLTGVIIPQLSDCVELQLINLSHNGLSGQLLAKFGDLQDLETLDVSFNCLDGEIPLSLRNCKSLTFLNLSHNDFSGSVPTGGVFSSSTNLSFLENPHLCGPLVGRTCRRSARKLLIAVAAGASSAALSMAICGVLLARRLSIRGAGNGSSSPVVRSNYPRISYSELVAATEDFSQAIMIGSGSYGRVYRGVLGGGAIVAVKVLNLQIGNSTRSFDRECQVLKRIRHRNLMRIVTACSRPDFKALVLPFMANGSLDGHLHSDPCRLSLAQRVSICSDVAEGMAYLHHHSPVKVIHCDLKPSNVLLNDEMTALVSDFGISRLVTSAGAGNTVENTANSTANLLCGSIGYIAPEYGYGLNASTKGDVYSFGVLVLEMVTRKRPTDETFEGGTSLPKWVKSHYHGRVEMIIDPQLVSEVRHQAPELRKMWEVGTTELLELGLLCTQESPSSRPTMMDTADDLERLKRYLAGDMTATFASSLGMSSSTIGDVPVFIDEGETSQSNFDD